MDKVYDETEVYNGEEVFDDEWIFERIRANAAKFKLSDEELKKVKEALFITRLELEEELPDEDEDESPDW